MAENPDANTPYSTCSHTQREQPDARVDQETINSFSKDFNVLPLFEKKLFDFTRGRYYSLRRNRLLACRWRWYVDTSCGRVRNPFQFPRVDDFHFYKYHTRYAPSQTISTAACHHRKLGVGPGVDQVGQMPIPDDMHLRKTRSLKRRHDRKI